MNGPGKRLGILLSGWGSDSSRLRTPIRGGAAKCGRSRWSFPTVRRPPHIAAVIDRGSNAIALPSKGLDREVYDRTHDR